MITMSYFKRHLVLSLLPSVFLLYSQISEMSYLFLPVDEMHAIYLDSPAARGNSQFTSRNATAWGANFRLSPKQEVPQQQQQQQQQQTQEGQKTSLVPGNQTEDRIVLFTFIFGREKTSKPSLRAFVETAATSGVDVVIVGDDPIPFALPDNFKWFQVTWEAFVDRIFEKLTNGDRVTKLHVGKFKDKEWDFAPMMAYLYPELVDGYQWWGHIDTHMMVGKIRHFLPQEILNENDIISGHSSKYTHNPFMLYRNTPEVNEVFEFYDKPFETTVLKKLPIGFSGEGGMEGIISKVAQGLVVASGLRVRKGTKGPDNKDYMAGKGGCQGGDPKNVGKWCWECIYDNGTLIRGATGDEIMYCRFFAPAKRRQHEETLKDELKADDMFESRRFRYGWHEGFQPLDDETFDPASENERAFYTEHSDALRDVNLTNMLTWGARIKHYGYSGKFFLDRFPSTVIPNKKQDAVNLLNSNKTSLNSTDFFFAENICHAAKAFEAYRNQEGAKPWPHVLLFHFDEDFGGFSSSVPDKTRQDVDLLGIWKKYNCTKERIWEYLDHQDTIAAFTNQFQSFYHPKVYSVPLGYQTPGTGNILRKKLRSNKQYPWHKPKPLMLNGKAYPERQAVMDKVIQEFKSTNVTLKNSYERTNAGFANYFEEMKDSRFILSPSGFGWDCYRHYEGIYLGAVPVIESWNRTDGWYRSLDDLPVAWIDTYDKLTPEWLETEYQRLLAKAGTYNYDKMTAQWWIDFVYSHLTSDLAKSDPAEYWTQMSKKGALSGDFEREYLDAHPEFAPLVRTPDKQPHFLELNEIRRELGLEKKKK